VSSKAIARADDPPLVVLLKAYDADISEALPAGYTPGRFKATCINVVRQNTDLLKCDPLSFVSTVLLAAQLGLEPGGQLGLSWIIPRRVDGKWTATFQIGYQGLRQLAYRSGVVSFVEARIVYQGDTFSYRHGMGGTVWSHDELGEPGREWTDVYCTAHLVTGAQPFEAMTKAEVLDHRDRYVPQWQKSKAWKENEPEMARKTVTAALCRQLPMDVEFRTALVADGAAPQQIAPDLAGLQAIAAAGLSDASIGEEE
jgi:recombination protein RecT